MREWYANVRGRRAPVRCRFRRGNGRRKRASRPRDSWHGRAEAGIGMPGWRAYAMESVSGAVSMLRGCSNELSMDLVCLSHSLHLPLAPHVIWLSDLEFSRVFFGEASTRSISRVRYLIPHWRTAAAARGWTESFQEHLHDLRFDNAKGTRLCSVIVGPVGSMGKSEAFPCCSRDPRWLRVVTTAGRSTGL